MPRAGIEPATRGFSVLCSTNWAIWAFDAYAVFTVHLKTTFFGRDVVAYAHKTMCFSKRALKTPSFVRARFIHLRVSCGSRIWTCDLRVMSPTSFQTAPPRDIKLCCLIWDKADDRTRTDNLLITNQLLCQLSHLGMAEWMEKDSNLRRRCQQIYSLPPLATRESIHIVWGL